MWILNVPYINYLACTCISYDVTSTTLSHVAEIADIAVAESLTSIVENINQSSTQTVRPKTISDFMGKLRH